MTEIERAAQLLRAGELVGIPTETVYGLAADARNPAAVAKIFAAKGRPADHPLIVHLPDASHLDHWAVAIPDSARQLAAAFWPGPLTLILKRAVGVSDAVTGGQDTVGLRVPNHPLALELLREFDGGLAAPSANRFGRISPTTAAHVREELGDRVALVLDGGPCAVGIESTILDLSGDTPTILRPGMLDVDAITRVLGRAPEVRGQGGSPRVSGSLEAHYAPRTPLRLVASGQLLAAVRQAQGVGRRLAVLARQPAPDAMLDAIGGLHWHSASADFSVYAHDLYASLRQLDSVGADLILVEAPPADEHWRAVADRLGRSAAGSGAA